MKRALTSVLIVFFLLAAFGSHAQKIVYSEPDKEDSRRMNFEVIGKVKNNFLIYKNMRGNSYISVLNNDMEQIEKVKHEYLPDERLINVDFLAYPDFVYMIYQYQKRNIVHCMMVKLNELGKRLTDPVELDTTHIGFSANNKIYTMLSSEDKSKLILFKINSRNKKRFYITTNLYNDKLELEKKTQLEMPMDERNDNLGEFLLDNDGNLVFTKFYLNSNDNISKAYLITKKAQEDSFSYHALNIDQFYLDELKIKIDNFSNRYFVNSFYYEQKRGNVEGLYYFIWDKTSNELMVENKVPFSEGLRAEARDNGNKKIAFNDYFIRNVVTRKDGGFVITAEAFYTTSRSGLWNRYNYMYGSPFSSPFDYYYSPYYSNWYWRSRNSYNNSVRYHADNIVIISYDKDGKAEWNSVIAKEQYDDDSDDRISYQIMNTGGQLHFLFNKPERRILLLNDFSLLPNGNIDRNPTLKNLDKGYEFMPKYAKQVSAKQMIIPCYYRNNFISFAKLEYN